MACKQQLVLFNEKPINCLFIPMTTTTDNFLALESCSLKLKELISMFGGKMFYLQQNFSFTTNPICDFKRIKSQFSGNNNEFSLLLTSHEVSHVISAVFRHLLQHDDQCKQPDATTNHISYADDTNFFKFANDFKVFNAHAEDVTSKFDWHGSYMCTFMFTINGMYQFVKNGVTSLKIQVKVKQMKVLMECNHKEPIMNNNSICYL